MYIYIIKYNINIILNIRCDQQDRHAKCVEEDENILQEHPNFEFDVARAFSYTYKRTTKYMEYFSSFDIFPTYCHTSIYKQAAFISKEYYRTSVVTHT